MRTMCGIFTMIYLQNWVISDVRANVGIHIPAPCFANMGNYLGHQFIEGTFFSGLKRTWDNFTEKISPIQHGPSVFGSAVVMALWHRSPAAGAFFEL